MNKKFFIMAFFALILISVSVVNSQFNVGYQTIGTFNSQYYNPSFSSGTGFTSPSIYWPEFNKEICRERQDFIVQIAPGGCQPAVVRSDLLEERNVPVFCKLMVIQANPLIDVSRVKSVRFSGKYPEGIAGISYFPPRYNLMNRRDLVDTPIDDNAGYFVVNLKREENEDKMPDWVGGNLTAIIDYDIENSLGIGKTYFYLSETDYDEWLRDYESYGFWNGKGYVKVDSIEEDKVGVSIYRDIDTKIGSVTLKKGETSHTIYLPGFYCAAGLNIRAEDIQAPVESALLQIDNQQIWVAKGDKIVDGKCSIREVDVYAGGGTVEVNCPVGRFNLALSPGKVTLKLNGTTNDYHIGGALDVLDTNIYLAYVGEKGKKFAVLINDPYSSNEIEFVDKGIYSIVHGVVEDKRYETKEELTSEMGTEIKKRIVSQYKKKLKADMGSLKEEDIFIIKEGEEKPFSYKVGKEEKKLEINFLKASIVENHNWEKEEDPSRLLAYEYYQEAIKDYNDLADFYPQEKRIGEDYFEPYAAEGLYWASVLAKNFNMSEDQQDFLNRLQREYPDSAWTRKAESDKIRLLKYDSGESRAMVNLREGSYFIEVLDFRKPLKEELSVDLLINGESKNLGLNEVWNAETNYTLQVTEIDIDSIQVRYDKVDLKTGSKTARLDLEEKKQTSFEDLTVKLVKINLKKQAKLSLDSEVKNTRAISNFSFKIGIEKRAIDLSPEKTKEMIQNIEESIEKWKDINEKLGKAVTTLKGACFATSAILIVKNMFSGFGGKSLARTEVMTRSGGWNDYCERIASSGEIAINGNVYTDPQACLIGHNDEIEKHVEIYAKYLESTNNNLSSVRGEVETTDILDFEGQLKDRAAMEQRFIALNKEDCKNWKIELPKKGDEPGGYLDEEFCDKGSFEHMKEISTLQRILEDPETSGPLRDMVKNDLARVAADAQNNINWEKEKAVIDKEIESKGLVADPTSLDGDRTTLAEIETLNSAEITKIYSTGESEPDLKEGEKIMYVFIPSEYKTQTGNFKANSSAFSEKGNYALVKLKSSGVKETYVFDKAYSTNGFSDNLINKDVKDYLNLRGATQFKESGAKAYQNKMRDPGKLLVKYFDRVPYKGLPAEVPFDIDEGWYVEMEYVLSGFGKPYDESGRVVNFYICNVGSNGLIEFKRNADDICRYYNGVSEELGFPGMEAGKSRQLVSRAKQAIAQAAKYYGKKEANINGIKFLTGTSFGGEAGRCSDFMSPSDCHLMFNLCDPVICPSSRCDLGGAFPVDNVIQTGIIGSLTLCLPNLKEKIYVPICLSGVHAGIEGYLSILESHRDCLNESLETGRSIGICDEIQSIYLCDFFWKQLVPFADVLLPKLIEGFFKQGVRGGGEYLTVQAAWQNTEKAIDYFKNEYAVNSMKAFNLRSTEEAGSEICKGFVSSRFPTDFDALTEPDSPVQYHAWFDENVMTTGTPYPTSHYKVYYHIYAGNDAGAYYIVYLKDISEDFTSYYTYTPEHYVVQRGYIARGETVDEAKDFTAPSGYKQLCVNINGQDECDFGKVSTSFAVDYLSDKYAEEQSRQQVTTSKDCVAGTPSMWSLAQPNLQAGAEEFVEPELYNQGIVRVCATYNPGRQVDSEGEYDTTNSTTDRWKDVGYCDDPSLRCWLDTDSVKDVIKNRELEKGVLKEVDTSTIGAQGYLTPEKSKTIASGAERSMENLKIEKGETSKSNIERQISDTVEDLEELAYLSPSNSHKARGYYLLAQLYKMVAERILGIKEKAKDNPNPQSGQDITTPGVSSEVKVEKASTTTTGTTPATTTATGGTELAEWTDDKLREGILIKHFENVSSGIFGFGKGEDIVSSSMYKSDRGWISTDEEFKKMDLNYVEGIREIVKKVGYTGHKLEVDGKNIYKTKTINSDDDNKRMIDEVFKILKK